ENKVATKIIGAIQDVSGQKKIEQELKKSNERFLLASRAASDAIYDWDLLTNEVLWSEGIHLLFGYSQNNIPADLWKNSLHPDDKEKVEKNLSRVLSASKKKIWKEEYQFRKADGSYSHVLDRGFIMRDNTGRSIRMVGSIQDITERKYNEQLLSMERSIFELSANPEVELKYIVNKLLKGVEAIYTDAYTSVIVLNADGKVESLAAPRLPTAYSKAVNGLKLGPEDGSCGEAIHNKKTIIVDDIAAHPEWKEFGEVAARFNLKACCSLPIVHSSNIVMGTFDIYYKEVRTPGVSEMNTLDRVRNILRILMEHHWSLNEIKIAKERFDIMMKATHDLIWDWDLEKNIIYRDEEGLKTVYGINDNETIKTSEEWIKRIHPDDRLRVKKVIEEIISSQHRNTFDVEYRFKKENGTFSSVYDRGMIIRNKDGKSIRMIGAAQDITERKEMEQELLQNELESQKAINQATVDTQEQERSEIGKELHDNVNQVLTTTKLYLDLALSNPELKDELIHKSSKNIIGVINEIRQLSRSLMDPSIGDLGLIDSINDLIESINLTRKLHVSLKVDKEIELILDKNHKLTIFRIIQEALNNAIKHAKATGVAIQLGSAQNSISLIIQDDGIGFDPDNVKKGVGLKNIQNRIYLINGTHSITSAPDKGCIIKIKFPIH
ncbi:MAG TPA: PAS domain-containing protein, partial [Flavisolibacter sp.]|nr:PAS domain-containing protein [Flavisolibacter sp.]